MDPVTLAVDLLAVAAIIFGALMVFAHSRIRAWWAGLTNKPPVSDKATRNGAEDPVRYALTIFGMMLLAFGIIILGFFTTFAFYRD